MQLLRTFAEVPVGPATVCCIGTFDGVHRGHQHLIRTAVDQARAGGMRCAVVTFFPHPRAVLGRSNERYLTLQEDKVALIDALGVDLLLIHEFTADTIHTRAEDFTRSMIAAFNMRSLWSGPDFAFGYRREGTAEWLRGAGRRLGFEMHVADPLLVGGRPVSSTRVREALGCGDMAEVELCLGRPYAARTVPECREQAAGRLRFDERQLLPAAGEYDVRIGGEVNRLTLEPQSTIGALKKQAPPCAGVVRFAAFA